MLLISAQEGIQTTLVMFVVPEKCGDKDRRVKKPLQFIFPNIRSSRSRWISRVVF